MTPVFEIWKQYDYLELSDNEDGRQFHRLSNLVHKLDKAGSEVADLHTLYDRFEKKRDSSKTARMFTEFSLICCHIAWLGRLRNDYDLAQKHQNFTLSSEQEGLIAFEQNSIAPENQATFFLPTHERCVGLSSSESQTFRKDLFESRSKKHFFPRIQSVLSRVWPALERDISASTLDATTLIRNEFLQFMHKQLLQNVLTHAYAEATHNPNYSKHFLDHYSSEGADFLFGSIAYLEIRALDPQTMSKNKFRAELASYHRLLSDAENQRYDRMIARKSRLIAFSYCDTGPGIERHLRHFSPQKYALPEKFDTKYVLDNRLAGRTVARAGEGLSDIRKHSQESDATLIIETAESTYLKSEQDGLEHTDEQTRVKRGTSVTILFET